MHVSADVEDKVALTDFPFVQVVHCVEPDIENFPTSQVVQSAIASWNIAYTPGSALYVPLEHGKQSATSS